MDYLGQKNDLVKKLDSDSSRGLSKDLAAKRLEENGPNKIESKKKKSLGKKIAEQIIDPMVILLIVASIVSAFTGDTVECFIIICNCNY